MRTDAVLNKFTLTHCYYYPYLLECIEFFEIECIQSPRFISIELDLHFLEQMYQHMTGNFVS